MKAFLYFIPLLFLLACHPYYPNLVKSDRNDSKVKFKIVTTDSTKSMFMDSIITLYPDNAFMSKNWYDRPWDGVPYGPSISTWQLYLPFSDTLIISVVDQLDTNANIVAEPNISFLKKGCYKLSIDSFSVKHTFSQRAIVHFCDSTFSRRMMLLK